MKSYRILILLLLTSITLVYAIVGDWVSYGSKLTQWDLYLVDGNIKSASHGGTVMFNPDNEVFINDPFADKLAHIDILSMYINTDGSQWYSYASGVKGISCLNPNGNNEYFDLDFSQGNAFAGRDGHVFLLYQPDLTPQLAHFVKYRESYIYHDSYNQFPGNPTQIYDLQVLGDSLFLSTDVGLIKAWVGNTNLKPQSAWESVVLETNGLPIALGGVNDTLYWADDSSKIFKYAEGVSSEIMSFTGEVVDFNIKDNGLSFASTSGVYDLIDESRVYQAQTNITGILFEGDTLWVAEEGKGLCRILPSAQAGKRFIPNTMNDLTANSLEIDVDHKVYVSGLEGVAILDGDSWHNLVYSPYVEEIHDKIHSDKYSADTLNIAYHGGSGERLVYDAMISSSGKLYSTITHCRIKPVPGQSENAKGPGALYEIDLNDYSNYEAYDTTNNMFEGTQGLGAGSESYLIMGGIAEYNKNIYVLNRHTLLGETLVRLSPNGNVRRYSKEDSNDYLQVLAREMVVDRFGRIWIANQARQEDVPRTDGGITVYDPNSNNWAILNTYDGLISNDVYSLDVDPLTGNIWAATAAGVQMIYLPSSISSTTDFTLNPEISGLDNMVPVKIRIDSQSNKWIITQSQGVQIYMSNNRYYNDGAGLKTENSGLLDNVVFDVVFDSKNGYAYLLTASGLNRFEIAWTEEQGSMDDVIVFPQPFRPGVDPYIAFDGLAEQSHVRITSIDGRVIHTFDSDSENNFEKQVVWDGKLANGEYISRGVYLAFVTNIDGLKASVKFAVE